VDDIEDWFEPRVARLLTSSGESKTAA